MRSPACHAQAEQAGGKGCVLGVWKSWQRARERRGWGGGPASALSASWCAPGKCRAPHLWLDACWALSPVDHRHSPTPGMPEQSTGEHLGELAVWASGLVDWCPPLARRSLNVETAQSSPASQGAGRRGSRCSRLPLPSLGAGGLQCTSSHWSRECCGTELSVCHVEMSARATDPRGITLGKCWGSVIRCRPQSH